MYTNRLLSSLTILLFCTFSNHSYADLNVQVFPSFNGYQKSNRWLALSVILSNEDNELECIVSASIQDKKAYSIPITLHHKSRKIVNLYVPPQKFYRSATVVIDDINGKIF